MSKNVTGTIREKKGLYYAVINYYGENEERKQKWFPTKLPVRGNKKKAEAILKQVLCEFEIPISKGEKVNLCVNQKIQIENTGDAAVVNVKSVAGNGGSSVGWRGGEIPMECSCKTPSEIASKQRK